MQGSESRKTSDLSAERKTLGNGRDCAHRPSQLRRPGEPRRAGARMRAPQIRRPLATLIELGKGSERVGRSCGGDRTWAGATQSQERLDVRNKKERLVERLSRNVERWCPIVRVTIHQNEYRMVQIQRKTDGWNFRLHRMFLDAPDWVIDALARYACEHGSDEARILEGFVNQESNPELEVELDRSPKRSRGTFFDLQRVFDELNDGYFMGAINASIAWVEGEDWDLLEEHCEEGLLERAVGPGLAAYCVEDRQIWVHRGLDAADIPRVYLEWVIYHEMLHQVHDMPIEEGHRIFHTDAFCRAEAAFRGMHEALEWEEKHRSRLLAALLAPVRRLGN